MPDIDVNALKKKSKESAEKLAKSAAERAKKLADELDQKVQQRAQEIFEKEKASVAAKLEEAAAQGKFSAKIFSFNAADLRRYDQTGKLSEAAHIRALRMLRNYCLEQGLQCEVEHIPFEQDRDSGESSEYYTLIVSWEDKQK